MDQDLRAVFPTFRGIVSSQQQESNGKVGIVELPSDGGQIGRWVRAGGNSLTPVWPVDEGSEPRVGNGSNLLAPINSWLPKHWWEFEAKHVEELDRSKNVCK